MMTLIRTGRVRIPGPNPQVWSSGGDRTVSDRTVTAADRSRSAVLHVYWALWNSGKRLYETGAGLTFKPYVVTQRALNMAKTVDGRFSKSVRCRSFESLSSEVLLGAA